MISDAIKIAILKSAPRLSHIELIELVVKECELQRQWVGLTDKERFELAVQTGAMTADWLTFMEAVEAKLKQKNGYAEEKNT